LRNDKGVYNTKMVLYKSDMFSSVNGKDSIWRYTNPANVGDVDLVPNLFPHFEKCIFGAKLSQQHTVGTGLVLLSD
jgi:hypothetical protein